MSLEGRTVVEWKRVKQRVSCVWVLGCVISRLIGKEPLGLGTQKGISWECDFSESLSVDTKNDTSRINGKRITVKKLKGTPGEKGDGPGTTASILYTTPSSDGYTTVSLSMSLLSPVVRVSLLYGPENELTGPSHSTE